MRTLICAMLLFAFVGCQQYEPPAGLAEMDAASAASDSGNYELAIEFYNEAIALDPKNGMAFDARARQYGMLSNYTAALSDLNEAIRLGEDSYCTRAGVHEVLGNDVDAKSDYKSAIEALTLDIKQQPTELRHSMRSRCYEALEKYDLAIADMKEAFKIEPDEYNRLKIEELKALQNTSK